MGQCASPAAGTRRQTNFFECEPVGTEALKDKQLPKLLFHSVLANVKIKNYPFKKATPLFKVREGEIFTLAAKDNGESNAITWKIYEMFEFQMTEYELRKQFLQVSILNEKNEQVSTVKINLFLITTGPYHQDFALHFRNNKIGRISFDLKISQIIDLRIESQVVELFLSKKHPGQQFCYSIKKINGFSGTSIQSQTSYPAVVLLQKKKKEFSRENQQSRLLNGGRSQRNIGGESNENVLGEGLSRKKSKRQTIIEIEQGQELKWKKQGGQLPVITTKVVASQLQSSYIQILVWKYQGNDQSTRELFVDCYVSFYKLLGREPQMFHEGMKEYQSRSINMNEKIEHLGKVYGSGSFQFTITNEVYFKQYQLCCHTEVGILKTTPIFGIQETKTTDKSPELHDLLAINHLVQQNIIALNKLESDEGPKKEIKQLKQRIQEELEQIFKLLQKTQHSPLFLYTYSSEKQLLEGQKILVQLGMKITQYIQSEDPIANDLCWLILISLIKRGEFNLSHMGFSDKQKKSIQAQKINELLLFKQQVANIYKVFLYKMLYLALNSIDHKGSEYERTFAQIFSAYAYFRIPEFRKEILLVISKESDPDIIEWRGVEFNLQDDIEEGGLKDKGNIFSEMFDWQRHFYKWLVRNEQIQSQNITLNQILAKKKWKQRFIKRGLAFFYFIKYWVTYIDSNLPNSRDVQWNYFPGYNRLLKAYFVELKAKKILQYPDAIMDAGLKLLSNYKLINPFFKILLNKVYVFDTSSVIRVLEYLNMILKSVSAKHKHLPFSFNYSFFFKALTIIFESDFSMSVSSALTLIYTHFDIFHFQFRKSISMYFLGAAFNNFFLHWSYNVREVFYHLLIYKIYGDAIKDDPNSTQRHSSIQNSDILSRYQDMMKILSFELKNYQISKKPNLHPSFDKSLFKKLKLKVYEELKSRQKMVEQCYLPKSQNCCDNSDGSRNEIAFKRETSQNESEIIKKQRCYSQIWSQGRINVVSKQTQHNVNKKQEIKRLSKYNQFSYEHEHVGKRTSFFHQIIPETEFQIRDINKNNLKLIQKCLKHYRLIEKTFIHQLDCGTLTLPTIKQEISIDKREIRPKQFDDW